ncbi:MAG TPA: GDP-mannose 4,6-dehydratase [Anaerolineae bacterium]|nr:GDP-mannose 4,6-dehydratase [Anaerolineae bacterium]HQI83208.1 GDP-mannose 4,6-dehydratase [Anaerolineae bacterium]
MNWEGYKLLITGASGFIGSHLVEEMVRRGAQVKAFVHYNSRGDIGLLRYADPQVLSEVELYFGDLKDPDAVRKAMEGTRLVFHLGALIGIPYSYVHPYDVVQTNVMGTLNVLTAARQLELERVIHTSTSEVYGSARYVPIDEAHPLQGQSPYSASKIGADKLAESFHLSFGMPITTVRPFNTYGPRQSTRAVIPTIIVQALTQDVIKLGNLDTTRDFTYVVDTARGFIAAAETEATIGEVFNLGVGEEISVGELANLIIKIVGRDVRIECESARMRPEGSEVNRLLSNNSKARQLTGWVPQFTFEQGLTQTIKWISQHLDIYQAKRYAI